MEWLKGPEILIILVLLVLLFGAKRLPDTARGLGRSLRIFKAETKGLRDDDEQAAQQVVPGQAQIAPAPAPTQAEQLAAMQAQLDALKQQQAQPAAEPITQPVTQPAPQPPAEPQQNER